MNSTNTLIKILSLLNGVCKAKKDNIENAERYNPEDIQSLQYLKGRLEEADNIRDKITRLIIEEMEGGSTH